MGAVVGFLVAAAVPCAIVYLLVRRNRDRAENAPLRQEVETRATFRTPLHRASVLGTGGFGGTRGMWIPLRGPKRLTVGPDSFLVSAPQALREFAFIGAESSIALSQAPSQFASRDWIVITGPAGGRNVRLAITGDNLPDVWHALAATGAASAPGADLEQPGTFGSGLSRVRGWRRVAVMAALVVLLGFLPALVDLIARHAR